MIAPTGILLAVALVAGVANALPPQKIIGGSPVAPGEFPYQVSLRLNGSHHCGASIISKSHIATAAHCLAGVDPNSLQVVTGSTHYASGEVHRISQYVLHPYYKAGDARSTYDIGVITLADEIVFNNRQNKIKLPSAPVPPGVVAVVTGWGVRASGTPLSPSLFKVALRTISSDHCQQLLAPTSIIYTNQVCTISPPGVGTCQGDSGGPLAYNGQLIGIVSYGIPCALGLPDVFTSVYDHLKFINENLNGQF